MKTLMICAVTAISALALPMPALAHGDATCTVPRSERQPSVRLQRQLKAAGWKIHKIQVYNGCYEVYGINDLGIEVEVLFDPRTLLELPGTT